MSLTYGLRSAKDLLEKLRREHSRIEREVTSDAFFNFVVTAYHLIEWVKKDPSIPAIAKNDLSSVKSNSTISVCRDLTNASKHFSLNSNYKKQVTSGAVSMRGWGVGRYGRGGYGVGEESISVELLDGTKYNAIALVRDTLRVWESFFAKHHL